MVFLHFGSENFPCHFGGFAIATRLDCPALATCREGHFLESLDDFLNGLRVLGVCLGAGFLEMAATAKRRSVVDIARTAELQRVAMVNLSGLFFFAAYAKALENFALDAGWEISAVGNCS